LDWIRGGIEVLEVAPQHGNRVTHCLPHVFDMYLKLLHPVYGGPGDTDRRIRWREIADLAKQPFTPEMHGADFHNLLPGVHLLGPGEGDMGAETLEELIRVLAPTVLDQPCFIYWELIATEDWKEALFTGDLADIPTAANLAGAYFDTPSYLWPADRRWLVCSDFDLTFTLIGADPTIAAQILAADNLETMAVESNTRIDTRAWPTPGP
jgi:hypothetical protein